MEIQTDITKQDWLEFSLYHHLHLPGAERQQSRAKAVSIFGVLFNFAMFFISDGPFKFFFLFLGLWSFLFIYILFGPRRTFLRKLIQRQVEKGENKGILGPHKITITAESAIEEGQFAQSKIDWRGVEKVAVAEEYLYIYNTSVSAIIVPKRSFHSDSEFQEFVRTAQEYEEQAKK